MGDWGGLPASPYRTPVEISVAKKMGDIAEKFRIEFILALGDNFYFDGVKDENDPRFQETYGQVYTNPSLQVPWYLIAGNHDHNGNVSAQIAYSKHEKRWNFPNYYYLLQFNVPGTNLTMDVVMIDTVQLCGNSDHDIKGKLPTGPKDSKVALDQWQWIEQQISSSKADYLIVAGHYPVYSVAEHGPTPELQQKLMPMLHKYKATAYFSGHDHNLQHLQTTTMNHTVNYFVSGAANFVDPRQTHIKDVPANSLKFHWANGIVIGGFAYAEATEKSMTFTFMEGNGKMLYQTTMYPRKL